MTLTPYDREYRTTDKTGWGEGPWLIEPDKAQWVDPVTGLDCLLVRNPIGALCGYVGVGPEHPWHGKGYSQCTAEPACPVEDGERSWDCGHSPESLLDVHGGITFADGCGHDEDESHGICHVPLPGRADDLWWFGFDCAHGCFDVMPVLDQEVRRATPRSPALPENWSAPSGWCSTYKTTVYVQAECASLARQLVEVGRQAVTE
jgi:hypothetical protein